MSRYVQLHILTSYPASNLNRDDLGRPKTMVMGDTQRLRISSQSLKRAWRVSDVFAQALGGRLGVRTKEIGAYVFNALTRGLTLRQAMDGSEQGTLPCLKENRAAEIAREIGGVFGKMKPESLETEQLAHLTPAEIEGVARLVEACRQSGAKPDGDALQLLRKDSMAVDVALFGRMLAASTRFNVEAAAQVAHPFTVHTAAVEEDFFTAVDDLNKEDAGAGHMGVAEFGAGLFYLYACIDRDLLKENLGGDGALAASALRALAEAACTVSPTGKQNSFASRACASFCLAEKGDAQPRTLSVAFLKPLEGGDQGLLPEAISRLLKQRDNFDAVYGGKTEHVFFNAAEGQGSLQAVCDFLAE